MSMPSFEESSRVRQKFRPERKIFDLPMARKTLPLVRAVAQDAVANHARHAHLCRARAPQRAVPRSAENLRQTFVAAAERDAVEKAYRGSVAELTAIGAILLDPVHGYVGFATLVNGGLAYLVLRLEDEDIRYWRYRDQSKLRPIPECWNHEEFFPAEAAGLVL